MSPSAVHGHVTVLSNPAFFGEVVPELFPEPAFLEEGFPISTKCFWFYIFQSADSWMNYFEIYLQNFDVYLNESIAQVTGANLIDVTFEV